MLCTSCWFAKLKCLGLQGLHHSCNCLGQGFWRFQHSSLIETRRDHTLLICSALPQHLIIHDLEETFHRSPGSTDTSEAALPLCSSSPSTVHGYEMCLHEGSHRWESSIQRDLVLALGLHGLGNIQEAAHQPA